MDIRLREIAGKAAGTYFMVTDNSGVTEIEETSNLRLFFINVENGPVNTIVVFKKGDTSGFQSIFGKRLRKKEKQGNFSIKSCLNALTAGPIAVMNLRVFNELDTTQIHGLNPNMSLEEKQVEEYSKLFNTNGLWTVKAKNMVGSLDNEHLLNIGNVGNADVSYFVTISKDLHVDTLTNEGDKTLSQTLLEIDEYPALKADTLVKDTFVDIWCFNNTFDPTTVSTNPYYGHLFNATGLMDYQSLESLTLIPESGFNKRITGSLIPNLKNEFDENISVDVLMNSVFPETGLICYINDDVLENEDLDDLSVINTSFAGYYAFDNSLNDNGTLLSHRLQDDLTASPSIDLDLITDVNIETNILAETGAPKIISYQATTSTIYVDENVKTEVIGIYENGIRVGARIEDENGVISTVKSIQILEADSTTGVVLGELLTYTKVKYILDKALTGTKYKFVSDLLRNGKIAPTNLISYKPRVEQFTNGSAARQNEILDMMISPGIVKGLKNFIGIRYVVDCFKTFIEGGYKYQFGQLVESLDRSNKFVRAFINEPFIEDLEKSVNPLFKQSPSHPMDISYLITGGNANYSTNFLSKFSTGSEMCFYFGSVLEGNEEIPVAADVSNLFIQKTYAFDVVANATGYLDAIDGLPLNPDDDERKAMEKFRWNPIIKMNRGFTIYGNSTGQKATTALSQIHNSELLAYIKESLYNLSRDEAFKKGTYNEYLATETEVQSFMNDLALAGAIQPNPIVICNASNNTQEISKQKIKLIHVEYFNIDALDKVVFDLNLK